MELLARNVAIWPILEYWCGSGFIVKERVQRATLWLLRSSLFGLEAYVKLFSANLVKEMLLNVFSGESTISPHWPSRLVVSTGTYRVHGACDPFGMERSLLFDCADSEAFVVRRVSVGRCKQPA